VPAASRRLDVLDILRGLAIVGTFGTNVWIFTNPAGPPDALASLPSLDSLAGAVETAIRFVFNGKALALLTLLFGVGLELQYRSARRRGNRWPGWYLWRAGLLFCEGLLHYVLVFEFDVLMGYAVASMVVAYLVGRSDRAVRWWMVGAGTLHVAFISLLTLGLLATPPEVKEQPLVAPSRPDLFSHGGYAEQVADRLALAPAYRSESVLIMPLCIVLFLAGSRLLRAGAFEDSTRGATVRRRLMTLGFGVGLPLNVLTTFAGPDWSLVDRYLLPPLVALGLLGLVTTVTYRTRDARRAGGPLRRGFIAVGRTSLSCYVLQNLVASVLCYGWGLGLASRLDGLRPWWVPGAWLGICALFTVLATWWLRRFERGPLELVWHWAYQAPQRGRARVASASAVGGTVDEARVQVRESSLASSTVSSAAGSASRRSSGMGRPERTDRP